VTPAPSARRADEVEVAVRAVDDLPRGEREAAGRRIASLAEYTDEPLLGARADDGRQKVLYLRHDGDYGLVEPA
jgi:hypothetical protein